MRNTVILIAGPTASGKSGLAVALAERIGGAVINADSMQVYRELHVLTARPSAKDEARAPHLLYGHVPGGEGYSAGRFAREAAVAIKDVQSQGLVPIVTGGTGLYFKTLTDGLSPIPAIADSVRQYWRAEAERLGGPALHAELALRDPVMAGRLQTGDSQRVTRALEVLDSTGRSLADWQKLPGEPVIAPELQTVGVVVMPERSEMHRRCDERFDIMMADGALEEARALATLGLDPSLPIMQALGVRPLIQLDRGELSAEAAVAQAKAETRQFAKRQVTWLKSNMIAWKRINTQQTKIMLAEIMAFIRSLS